jgi:hypothetical protein
LFKSRQFRLGKFGEGKENPTFKLIISVLANIMKWKGIPYWNGKRRNPNCKNQWNL